MKASVSKEVDSNSENKTCGSLLPSIAYIYMCFHTHMHRSIHEIDFHFLKCTYFKTATLSVCTVKYKNTHRKTCTQNIKSDIPFFLTHLNKRSQKNSHFYYDNIYLKTEAKNNNNKTAFCCSWGWNERSYCLSDQSNKPWDSALNGCISSNQLEPRNWNWSLTPRLRSPCACEPGVQREVWVPIWWGTACSLG